MATKDAGLRIRIEKDLRDEFLSVCRDQDKRAAKVLRDFMRHYIEAHRQAEHQPDLFASSPHKAGIR